MFYSFCFKAIVASIMRRPILDAIIFLKAEYFFVYPLSGNGNSPFASRRFILLSTSRMDRVRLIVM